MLYSEPLSFKTPSAATSQLEPTSALANLMARARVQYGCGLSFQSLDIFKFVITELTSVLSSDQSSGRVLLSDSMKQALSLLDSDICQAAQSCTEALQTPREEHDLNFLADAREKLADLSSALADYEKLELGPEVSLEMGQLCLDSLKQLLEPLS